MNDSFSQEAGGNKTTVTFKCACLLLICLCGCHNPFRVFATLAPQQSAFSKSVVESAKANAGQVEHYRNSETLTNRHDRDRYIMDAMVTIDEEFKLFVRELGVNITGLDTLNNLAVSGTTLAAAGVPTASTKTILSLIASGLVGTKATAQKNYFNQLALPAFVAKMIANRERIKQQILLRMRNNIELYDVNTANLDLLEYERAGGLFETSASIVSEAVAASGGNPASLTTALPQAPTEVTITNVAPNQALVTWKGGSNTVVFDVQTRTNATAPFANYGVVLAAFKLHSNTVPSWLRGRSADRWAE